MEVEVVVVGGAGGGGGECQDGWGQQRHGAGAMCVVEADDVTPGVGGPAEIELDGSSDFTKNRLKTLKTSQFVIILPTPGL